MDERAGTSSRRAVRGRVATLVVVALLGAPGCRIVGSGPTATATGGPTIRLRDFRIDLSEEELPAGPVDLQLTNSGPTVHELILLRTDRPADRLPLGPDGLSVQEHLAGARFIAEQEDVELGEHDRLRATLAPGRYVVLCNLEGHYLAGMRASFRVVR